MVVLRGRVRPPSDALGRTPERYARNPPPGNCETVLVAPNIEQTGKIACREDLPLLPSLRPKILGTTLDIQHRPPRTISAGAAMTFLIDKNTTVEGNLKVNANAAVTNREESGSNVAIISVRITQ